MDNSFKLETLMDMSKQDMFDFFFGNYYLNQKGIRCKSVCWVIFSPLSDKQ